MQVIRNISVFCLVTMLFTTMSLVDMKAREFSDPAMKLLMCYSTFYSYIGTSSKSGEFFIISDKDRREAQIECRVQSNSYAAFLEKDGWNKSDIGASLRTIDDMAYRAAKYQFSMMKKKFDKKTNKAGKDK